MGQSGSRPLRAVALAFSLAVPFFGAVSCGGGGGGSSSTTGGGSSTTAANEQVVAAYDYNNDQTLDVVTLDTTKSPFRIVTVLEGTSNGDFVDGSARAAGQPIDAKISDALAAYLAGSVEVATGTDLQVTDSAGRDVTVTIYE